MSEIQINSSDLSKKGYSNLAILAGDDKITAEELASTPAAIDDMQAIINKLSADADELGGVTKAQWKNLLAEVTKNNKSIGAKNNADAKKETNSVSPIAAKAEAARTAVKSVLEPAGKVPDDYLSAWRVLKAQIPGMEVAGFTDIGDALNQSRKYNLALIDYLEREYQSDDLNVTFKWRDAPGWYPSFDTEVSKSVEEKREKIAKAIENITTLWSNEKSTGMGWAGWTITIIALAFGFKSVLKGGKFVLSKVGVFGIGNAVVSGIDAMETEVGGKGEKIAGGIKAALQSSREQQKAILQARGFIDPTGSDFQEYFNVGKKTLRGDATLSEEEKIRRLRALETLQAEYVAKYQAGKLEAKFAGSKFQEAIGRIMMGDFGMGNIDNRMDAGRTATAKDIAANVAKNTVRKIPGVGRFFQGGQIGALDAADNLKTGNTLDSLIILGEELHFKDAETRTAIEDIMEASKVRARALRIQEKIEDIGVKTRAIAELETELKTIPQTIELQTDSTNFAQTQIMKRQEVNPVHTEKTKAINALKLEKHTLEAELIKINPGKLEIASVRNIIDAEGTKIESKIIDLKTAYPNANIPTYDRSNRGVNFEKFTLRIAKIVKR